jgi:hypothetical protein
MLDRGAGEAQRSAGSWRTLLYLDRGSSPERNDTAKSRYMSAESSNILVHSDRSACLLPITVHFWLTSFAFNPMHAGSVPKPGHGHA